MLTLTDSEAADIVALVLRKLEVLNALDVIAGIDESRRLGIEEPVMASLGEESDRSRGELRKLGTVRRRPPTELEMLRLVFERLHQRLVVVPAIARTVEKELRSTEVVWRVDHEFVPSDRSPLLEAHIHDLLPNGTDDVVAAYQKIAAMIPQLVPPVLPRG